MNLRNGLHLDLATPQKKNGDTDLLLLYLGHLEQSVVLEVFKMVMCHMNTKQHWCGVTRGKS